MGPGNERWPVVKFTVAPFNLPYKIVYGPVSAWSKIFHGPVEISFQNKSLFWSRIFHMKKTGKKLKILHDPVPQYIKIIFGPVEILY